MSVTHLTSDKSFVDRAKDPVDPCSRKAELTKTMKISFIVSRVGFGVMSVGLATMFMPSVLVLCNTLTFSMAGIPTMAGALVTGIGFAACMYGGLKETSTAKKLKREFQKIEL